MPDTNAWLLGPIPMIPILSIDLHDLPEFHRPNYSKKVFGQKFLAKSPIDCHRQIDYRRLLSIADWWLRTAWCREKNRLVISGESMEWFTWFYEFVPKLGCLKFGNRIFRCCRQLAHFLRLREFFFFWKITHKDFVSHKLWQRTFSENGCWEGKK